MENYADNIIGECVKWVIGGCGEGKNAVKGTGDSLNYYESDERLLLADGIINPAMDIQNIRITYGIRRREKPCRIQSRMITNIFCP